MSFYTSGLVIQRCLSNQDCVWFLDHSFFGHDEPDLEDPANFVEKLWLKLVCNLTDVRCASQDYSDSGQVKPDHELIDFLRHTLDYDSIPSQLSTYLFYQFYHFTIFFPVISWSWLVPVIMNHICLFAMFTLIKTGESLLLDSLANNPLTLDLDAVITGTFLPENMATHVLQNTINYMVTSLFWVVLMIILVRGATML